VETAKNLSPRHWPQSSPIVKTLASRKLIFQWAVREFVVHATLLADLWHEAAKVRHFIHFPYGPDVSNTFHPPFSFTLSRMPLSDVKKAKAISRRFGPSGTEKKLLHDSLNVSPLFQLRFMLGLIKKKRLHFSHLSLCFSLASRSWSLTWSMEQINRIADQPATCHQQSGIGRKKKSSAATCATSLTHSKARKCQSAVFGPYTARGYDNVSRLTPYARPFGF